jgi:hypothetical protein
MLECLQGRSAMSFNTVCSCRLLVHMLPLPLPLLLLLLLLLLMLTAHAVVCSA